MRYKTAKCPKSLLSTLPFSTTAHSNAGGLDCHETNVCVLIVPFECLNAWFLVYEVIFSGLLCGAGGTARAAAYALKPHGSNLQSFTRSSNCMDCIGCLTLKADGCYKSFDIQPDSFNLRMLEEMVWGRNMCASCLCCNEHSSGNRLSKRLDSAMMQMIHPHARHCHASFAIHHFYFFEQHRCLVPKNWLQSLDSRLFVLVITVKLQSYFTSLWIYRRLNEWKSY